jgi:hypothetical protein
MPDTAPLAESLRRALNMAEGRSVDYVPPVGRKNMIGIDADHAVAGTGAGGGEGRGELD